MLQAHTSLMLRSMKYYSRNSCLHMPLIVICYLSLTTDRAIGDLTVILCDSMQVKKSNVIQLWHCTYI